MHDSNLARMHRIKLTVETEEIQAEMEWFLFPGKQKGSIQNQAITDWVHATVEAL